MWAVKPHYFTPFYNWPYTFGLLFGIGLYAKYVEDPERFRAGYDDLLSATGMADAASLTGPVRLRRARPRVLGVEPRRHRPPHRRLRSAWPRPRRRGVTDVDALLAEARRATVHGLGLLVACARPDDDRAAVGLHADGARCSRGTRPTCSTWAPAAGSGWPRCRRARPLTIASEAWPPNVALAARHAPIDRGGRRAGRRRARQRRPARHASPRGRCRTAAGAFHLVVNRHEAFVAREVARVLAPGGVFLTQQVDNGNLDDCFALFALDAPPLQPSWLPVAVAQVEAAGLSTEDARTRRRDATGSPRSAALVWYLERGRSARTRSGPASTRCTPRARSPSTPRCSWPPVAIRQRRLLVRAASTPTRSDEAVDARPGAVPRTRPATRPGRTACRPRPPVRVSRTSTRSAISTVVRRWAMITAVRSASSVRSARCTSRSDGMSSDDVASSRISTAGSARNARAKATSCRCPAESRAPFWCTSVS